MQVPAAQVARVLQGELAPAYLVSGEEPLQRMEASDAIRAAARAHGIETREVYEADARFDWSQLDLSAQSLSLFGDRKLIDLRLAKPNPGKAGAAWLQAYAEQSPEGVVLLVQCGKMTAKEQQQAWVRAIERGGVLVRAAAVQRNALPAWIERRAAAAGVRLDRDAARLLAERVEGNLLAAAQEIEKLALLDPGQAVDAGTLARAVGDSSRYTVYELADAALAGDAARAVHILDALREEGTEPVLILWALAREVRTCAQVAAATAAGEPAGKVLARLRVWASRKALIESAARRLPAPAWNALLRQCAYIDRSIKGLAGGVVGAELLELVLRICGRKTLGSGAGLGEALATHG